MNDTTNKRRAPAPAFTAPGNIVLARLASGETYATIVRPSANRRAWVVLVGGVECEALSVKPAPEAVRA